MAGIKATKTEKLKVWKERIIANLLSRFSQGMTENDIKELYPTAELQDIKDAIKELITEGKVEIIP